MKLKKPNSLKGYVKYTLLEEKDLKPAQAIILAVNHNYYQSKDWNWYQGLLENKSGVVADIKGSLDRSTQPDSIELWRL